MINLNFENIDPYDWFCGPGSHGFERVDNSPKSLLACEKQLMRRCNSFSSCATRTASSAKSSSLISTLCTLALALRHVRLNRFPSLLVWMYIPSSDWLKAHYNTREKKMPKSVGARTHPCLTPLRIGKGVEYEPSYWTVPCMSSWKDTIILRSLGRHPILWSTAKRPFLLTESKAFVRSMKEM